jgi:hypothetical protein
VIDATSAKLLTEPLSSRKPEIGDGDAKASIKAQNILRLQIAVIDTKAMAILDCVKQLQEDMLDKSVISQIPTAVQNLAEQISIAGIFHDDVRVTILLDNTVKGCDPRMS